MPTHKTYPAEFKAKVALTALNGSSSIEQLSSEFALSRAVISRWKNQLLKNAELLFPGADQKDAHAQPLRGLHARLDKLAKDIFALSGQQAAMQDSFSRLMEKLEDLKAANSVARKRADAAASSASEAVWGISFHDAAEQSAWLKDRRVIAGRWAIGYPALYALYRILDEAKPKKILELGLGMSTRIIGQYAAAFADVEHTVVEHDPEWIAFVTRGFSLSGRSRVVQLSREFVPFREAEAVRSFAGFAEAFKGRRFDFIFIDAPLGGDMKQYSRIDVLKLMPGCLDDEFIIMLDDTSRSGEIHTFDAMISCLDDADIAHKVGHYQGDKKTSVICSAGRRFFASM